MQTQEKAGIYEKEQRKLVRRVIWYICTLYVTTISYTCACICTVHGALLTYSKKHKNPPFPYSNKSCDDERYAKCYSCMLYPSY